ncbi:hypothetical protein H8356DRAFT_965625 [Neocallimastix lanati (nom. inval.)]|nr:hypothetical protein H8356DRAFT_965625 [Neocallimastix sp. JGI-2020a]
MKDIQSNFKKLYEYHKYNLNSLSYKNDNSYDFKKYYKNEYMISQDNDKNNLYQKQILLRNTNNCNNNNNNNNNNNYNDFDFISCDKNNDIKKPFLNLEFLGPNYKEKYNNDISTQICSDIYNFSPETEEMIVKDNKNIQYPKQISLGNNNNNISNIDYYIKELGLKYCDKNNINRNCLNSVLLDPNYKESYDNDVITISGMDISNFSQEKFYHNNLVENKKKRSNNTNNELMIYQSNIQYPYQNINKSNILLTTSKTEKSDEYILPKNYNNEYIQSLKENDISIVPLFWKKENLNKFNNISNSGQNFGYEYQIFNNNFNPEQDFSNEKQFLNNQLSNGLFNDIYQNNTSMNKILINISNFNNKDKKALPNSDKNIVDIKMNINQINMIYQNYIISDKSSTEQQYLYKAEKEMNKTKYILYDESKQKNTTLQKEKRENIIKYDNASFSKGLYVNTNTEGQINSKVRLFYGAKPFKCNYCKTTFKRKYDLLRHKRIHTGEKPYVCKICNRRFNRTDILKKHLKESINCSKHV